MRSQSPYDTLQKEVASAIRRSIEYAYANREASRAYIKAHAQEMDDHVIDGHVDLYVNDTPEHSQDADIVAHIRSLRTLFFDYISSNIDLCKRRHRNHP